jgi:RNA polymerase sigma factor (sigma-70 family)
LLIFISQPGAIFRLALTGAKVMSEADFDPLDKGTLEELFAQAEALLPKLVRQAFLRFGHRPNADEEERLAERLKLQLYGQGDYRLLRTLKEPAALSGWLQVIANRAVSRFLQHESRKVGFDEVPQEKLVQPPEQEELLWRKEQKQLLQEALPKLTEHERKRVELMLRGLNPKEIALSLNIKVSSVHRMKSKLVKKLRELVNEGRRK